MHTSRSMRTDEFEVTVAGTRGTFDDILPGLTTADRIAIVTHTPGGSLAAAPLLPAFVPAACQVSAAGASRRGLIVTARRAWRDVRRIDDVPVGLLLSPFSRRDWRDSTRALTLPMPAPRRAELRGLVRGLWGAHGG